jgi:hypothetical protein
MRSFLLFLRFSIPLSLAALAMATGLQVGCAGTVVDDGMQDDLNGGYGYGYGHGQAP